MYWKGIVTELIWFLRGDTNIKFLVDNNCHIWDGDAYKNYCNHFMDEYLEKNELSESYRNSLKPHPIDEFINKIKTDDEFANKWGELGPVYGKQWRKWGYDSDKWREDYNKLQFGSKDEIEHLSKKGIDQIANSINLLKTDPDSRRNRVNAWNVGELDQMVLPPCHTDFQFFTRVLSTQERYVIARSQSAKYKCPKWDAIDIDVDGNPIPKYYHTQDEHYDKYGIPKRAISLMFNMRSTDVGLGLSFNLSSYGLLLMMIAKQVNMVPDELIYNGGDVHLYLNHIEPIKEQLTREPYELPTVKLSNRDVNDISEYTLHDITLEGYQSHPSIKMPLSN
jgi:thymidylate synthase